MIARAASRFIDGAPDTRAERHSCAAVSRERQTIERKPGSIQTRAHAGRLTSTWSNRIDGVDSKVRGGGGKGHRADPGNESTVARSLVHHRPRPTFTPYAPVQCWLNVTEGSDQRNRAIARGWPQAGAAKSVSRLRRNVPSPPAMAALVVDIQERSAAPSMGPIANGPARTSETSRRADHWRGRNDAATLLYFLGQTRGEVRWTLPSSY